MYSDRTSETTEHTEWHTVTLWRGLAETVDRFVRKNVAALYRGRLRTRSGPTRTTTNVIRPRYWPTR